MAKAIIFSLDAAAAFVLLVSAAAVLVLFSLTSPTPSQIQENVQLKAADSIAVLSQVKVSDLRREPEIAVLFDQGIIGLEAMNYSLVQLAADLWASGDSQNLSYANDATQAVLSKLFPASFNFAVYASNQSLSNQTPSGDYAVASAGRTFVSGVSSDRNLALGCVARAFVQKIRGKQELAQSYFGGFDGQGNLTVSVRGVPSDANATSISIQANPGSNFTLYLNGVDCGVLNKTGSAYDVEEWVFNSTQGATCLNAVAEGTDNLFTFNFTTSNVSLKYFGGGIAGITFETADLAQIQSGTMRHYFTAVHGVINQYSSFYVPGNVTQVTGRLHLLNNYTTFLIVGNKTVYEDNGTNETRVVQINNSNFSTAFANYDEISLKTVPMRLGVRANLTGHVGNADVVLITDVSGSMDWRMDQDGTSGTARACDDVNLYASTTKRISVAKCVDKSFVSTILGGVGNRIALVSFSDGIDNHTEFSNNSAYLQDTIDDYPASGGTCIACAINKAYEIIRELSGVNRTRHVIVMSDGVANYRGAGWCSLLDQETAGVDFVPGDLGGFIHLNATNSSNWTDYDTQTGTDIFTVSGLNSSFALAAGDTGRFYSWNGSTWAQTQDAGTMDFYGIDVLNSTLGMAVGTSGKIYTWNGVTWSENTDRGSEGFRGVSLWNASSAAIVGFDNSDGYLLRWNGGTTYTETVVGSREFYDVKHLNSTWAFAVGDSGKIYRLNGGSWAQYQDTGSHVWRAISVVNESSVFVAGESGSIYRWAGGSFASFASPTSDDILGISFDSDVQGRIVTSTSLVYYYNSGTWTLARDARYTGTLSTAAYCSDSDSCGTSFSNNYAAQNANWSSCRLRSDLNTTNYAVGFGPVASCSLGNVTLYSIAQCGNGTYFSSTNASALAEFYTSLAQAIVQQSNSSQTISVGGDVETVLLPDSYLEFTFDPQYDTPYQSISITKTADLASCQGTVSTPANFTVYDFKVFSYSADRWTSNVSISSTLGFFKAFNLSVFNQTDYTQTGDPFLVQVNPSLVRQGGSNLVDVRTAISPSNQSSTCSQDNSVAYKGWINASVGYGSFFSYCFARNVTVYYDLDGDNVADGFDYVLVGGNTTQPAILASELNQNGTNAVEDAFQRLLRQLDLSNNGQAPGSQQNPIDIALSGDIGSGLLANTGLPALNSTDFSVVVWR